MGIVPKPAGKQEGGHCSLMPFLPDMTTDGPLPFNAAVTGDGRPDYCYLY